MAVLRRMFCLFPAVALAFVGTLLLKNVFVKGSLQCGVYELPCEDGECIDSDLWCDSHTDCSDGSDEKYCKKTALWNSNPNKCPSNYFKCIDGPCIPQVGRCDGFVSCGDSSDEKNCGDQDTSTRSIITTTPLSIRNLETTFQNVPTEGYNSTESFASQNGSKNTVQAVQFSVSTFFDFSAQRTKAWNWILSQMRSDYGWADETPRAVTALYLSDNQPTSRNSASNLLMIKQLETQLSLEIARNETRPMKLTDLALYIKALQVSCKNPKNFYGDDLVSSLRDSVNSAQKEGTFVNPSVYLTLCLNNATTNNDTKHLENVFSNWNTTINKIDMQALAFLTTSCVFRKTNYLNASVYDSIKTEFLRIVKVHGFPGNVYEAALMMQALKELNMTLTGLTDYVLKQQQADGSFGDILSTYLVLPILAGRNTVQMNDYCEQRNIPDLIPLEVLRNVKSRKIQVQYSLNDGIPPEVTLKLQMHVAKGTHFFDIMRLAQDINPKYRFKLNENREIPVVYSVGEMPNDVEKGMYWTLYRAPGNSTESASEEHWVPYNGDIKNLILEDGDKVLFWYRPV